MSFPVYVVLNIRVFVLRKFTSTNQFGHFKLENLRISILISSKLSFSYLWKPISYSQTEILFNFQIFQFILLFV